MRSILRDQPILEDVLLGRVFTPTRGFLKTFTARA